MTMHLNILYFASLREALGRDREAVEVPAGVMTAGALREWLVQRDDVMARALGPSRALRMAVNKKLAVADTLLHDGAEVAFFPPVTGG